MRVPVKGDKDTQFGFTAGQRVVEVVRCCSSEPGQRRWAAIEVDAGQETITIEASARRVHVRRRPRKERKSC